MFKKRFENFKLLNEKEVAIGNFENYGYRVLIECGMEGIEDDKIPRFTLLFKYEKRKNYFIFVSAKRNYVDELMDVSTQLLVIPRHTDIKMVARNQYFDAQDDVGNIVHIELDTPTDAISILNTIMMFKK